MSAGISLHENICILIQISPNNILGDSNENRSYLIWQMYLQLFNAKSLAKSMITSFIYVYASTAFYM